MDLSGSGSGGNGSAAGVGRGELWKAIEGAAAGSGKRREGWQMLGPKEVMSEVERQAFKALTGRRMG